SFYHGSGKDQGLEKRIETEENRMEYPVIELTPNGTEQVARASKPIIVKIGNYGPYVQMEGESGDMLSASIPDDIAPADFTWADASELLEAKAKGPEIIGRDPDTGLAITVQNG